MRKTVQPIVFKLILIVLVATVAVRAWADSSSDSNSTGNSTSSTSTDGTAPGYLSDVSGERADRSQEFVILPPPAPQETTKLYDKIFTDKLKENLINNYRKTFGYTEYEQIQTASNQFGSAESDISNRLLPMDQYIAEQQSFGRYMINAMAEYHLDNYFKHSATMKQVYAAQKKISNVQYQTASGAKLKVQYDLASSTATVTFNKPHSKFHKALDVQVGGTANTILRLGYDVNHRVNLESDVQFEDEIVTLTANRHLEGNFNTNVSLQSINKDQDIYTPKQNRILVGLSWND